MAWFRCIGSGGGSLKLRTATGDIANFETNLKSKLNSCKCTINPLQSGTGTPSPSNPRPISGFSGANIVRCGVNLFNPDNILKGSYDTATNNWSNISGSQVQAFNFNFKANTQYTFSGIETQSEAGKNARLVIRYTDGTSENIFADTSTTPTAFTKTSASGKSINFVYYGYGSSSTNGVSIKNFQIEYGTTAHDFAPYIGSQYAPYFEGLLNGSYGFVDLSTLTWVYASGSKRWEAQKTDMKSYGSRSADVLFEKYETDTTATAGDENKGFISGLVIYVASTDSVNSPTGMCIYPLATPTTPTITQSQIDTLINAFNDDLTSVVFGQTVYGGVADVTNGKVTVTHKLVTLNGSEAWSATGTIYTLTVPDMESGTDLDGITNYIQTVQGAAPVDTVSIRFGYNSKELCVYQANNYLSGVTDLASFKTYLSNNNLQICYPLATPTEITLTPKQIEALVGINNVYHDCNGEIEVKYLVRE